MKKISKFLTALVINLLMLTPAFAKNGIMAGEGHVQMAQTEWFDIIYGDEAKESAAVLYLNADDIYLELAEMYGWNEPPCRLPVVLTTQVEIFNAYFSTGNYSHIVLYVTNPIEELANQPDSLLWTFRHELTHAYNYNMKSKVTTAWTAVFGDASTFHTFCVTPGVAEGATLTSESIKGNGRLNDEFMKQYVKQAKLEGKFPKFSDIQGSRDIYPRGGFYYFNGAFHEYLQREYGLEKYAKFWYNCINNSISTSGAFRKAYGLKLRNEWAKFEAQYKVPLIPEDPLKSKSAQDLFTPNSNQYSVENCKGAIFAGLSQSEKGITYFDELTGKVFFISKENLNKEKIIPEYLFQMSSLQNATQSLDGRFITVSYYNSTENNYRYDIAVYDTETKKWYKPKYHGVKNGIVVKQGQDYYLVALKFKGEKSAVKITKLIFNEKGQIKDEAEAVTYDFTRTQMAANFIPLKDGSFAYILNDSLTFSVQVMDLEGRLSAEYKVPASEDLNHYVMHYLSVNNTNPDELYFSWVSEGTMPRAGKLNLADGEFSLSSEDLSGGVYYPVNYENELIYVGKFYEYNRLFRKNADFKENRKYFAEKKSELSEAKEKSEIENLLIPIINQSSIKAYNPFKYLRGTFIPLSELTSSSYDSNHKGSYSLPLGITYMTNNPWDSLSYTFSAGWGPHTNSTAVSFTVAGTTDTGNLSCSSSIFSEFDYKGVKAGEFSLSAKLGNVISLRPSLFIHAGRSNASTSYLEAYSAFDYTDYVSFSKMNQNFGAYGNHDDINYLYTSESVLLSINTTRRFYDNRHSIKGLYAGIIPSVYSSYDMTNQQTDYNYSDVTLFAEYFIPRLIPIDCKYGKTYNLPLKLLASAFSTDTVYTSLIALPAATADIPAPSLAVVAAEITLFGQDFQTSLKSLPLLYFHDVYVSLIGAIGFDYKNQGKQSMGICHISDYASEIASGDNKLMGIFALKFTSGLNFLNFGALARYQSKRNISVIPTLTFTSFDSKPVYKTNFELELSF